jgi:hypothetical protein
MGAVPEYAPRFVIVPLPNDQKNPLVGPVWEVIDTETGKREEFWTRIEADQFAFARNANAKIAALENYIAAQDWVQDKYLGEPVPGHIRIMNDVSLGWEYVAYVIKLYYKWAVIDGDGWDQVGGYERGLQHMLALITALGVCKEYERRSMEEYILHLEMATKAIAAARPKQYHQKEFGVEL